MITGQKVKYKDWMSNPNYKPQAEMSLEELHEWHKLPFNQRQQNIRDFVGEGVIQTFLPAADADSWAIAVVLTTDGKFIDCTLDDIQLIS